MTQNAAEELSMALNVLRKYNMPVSPILEYAIQERISELGDAPMPDNQPKAAVESKPDFHIEYSPFDGSLEEKFEKYLYSKKSPSTARNYVGNLNKPIRHYISKLVTPNADSVYSFATVEAVKGVIAKLKSSEEFMNDNMVRHNALTASLGAYLHFIEEIDK